MSIWRRTVAQKCRYFCVAILADRRTHQIASTLKTGVQRKCADAAAVRQPKYKRTHVFLFFFFCFLNVYLRFLYAVIYCITCVCNCILQSAGAKNRLAWLLLIHFSLAGRLLIFITVGPELVIYMAICLS